MNDIDKYEKQRLIMIITIVIIVGLWIYTNNQFLRWTGLALIIVFIAMMANKPKYFITRTKMRYFTEQEKEEYGGISGEGIETMYLRRNGANEWVDCPKKASVIGLLTGIILVKRLRKQESDTSYEYHLTPYHEEQFFHYIRTGETI